LGPGREAPFGPGPRPPLRDLTTVSAGATLNFTRKPVCPSRLHLAVPARWPWTSGITTINGEIILFQLQPRGRHPCRNRHPVRQQPGPSAPAPSTAISRPAVRRPTCFSGGTIFWAGVGSGFDSHRPTPGRAAGTAGTILGAGTWSSTWARWTKTGQGRSPSRLRYQRGRDQVQVKGWNPDSRAGDARMKLHTILGDHPQSGRRGIGIVDSTIAGARQLDKPGRRCLRAGGTAAVTPAGYHSDRRRQPFVTGIGAALGTGKRPPQPVNKGAHLCLPPAAMPGSRS